MIHDLRSVEASQERRSRTIGTVLALIVALLFLSNFKAGLLAIPFAIVTALFCGRVSVTRYDDTLEQLEIIEYCPWLPGCYRKVIPRKHLKGLLCTTYHDDDNQEFYDVSITNTANEFISLCEQMRPDDENLARFARLLNLDITRRPA
jgi:hypothetical protein